MPDQKKRELGIERPLELVLGELGRGLDTLRALHPKRFVPVLVPPWNRIDAGLVPHLRMLGFRALSVYGPEKPAALPVVNTHVDVMDWHGTRGGRHESGRAAILLHRVQQRGAAGGPLRRVLVHVHAGFGEGCGRGRGGHPVAPAQLRGDQR